MESRLSTPLILAHNCEILLEPAAPQSQALLGSVLPRARRDLAAYVQANDAWADESSVYCPGWKSPSPSDSDGHLAIRPKSTQKPVCRVTM